MLFKGKINRFNKNRKCMSDFMPRERIVPMNRMQLENHQLLVMPRFMTKGSMAG